MELTEIEVWGDQDLLTPVKLVVNTEISKKYNYHKSICPQAKMRIFFSWVVEDGAKKKRRPPIQEKGSNRFETREGIAYSILFLFLAGIPHLP